MLRMDEKIAEGENKVYSLRSELARVRLVANALDVMRRGADAVDSTRVRVLGPVGERRGDDPQAQGPGVQVRRVLQAVECISSHSRVCPLPLLTHEVLLCVERTRQARHIKECLKLTKELLLTSARDASLALRVGAQQVRTEFTAKQLKRAEQHIRCVSSTCKAMRALDSVQD